MELLQPDHGGIHHQRQAENMSFFVHKEWGDGQGDEYIGLSPLPVTVANTVANEGLYGSPN